MKYVIDRKTYEVRYQFLIGNVRRKRLEDELNQAFKEES